MDELRIGFPWRMLIVICTASLLFGRANAQAPKLDLTVDQIVALHQAGLSDDVIITKIRKSGKAFDLGAEELLKLKKEGLPDPIIKAMLDASPPAGEVPDLSKPPEAGIPAANVPSEAGIYYLNGSEPVKIDQKTLASAKTAGRMGHIATLGVKSVKTNAYVIGPTAKIRVKEFSPVFYMRLPEGMSMEEVVLVTVLKKSDRRELEVAASSGVVGSKRGLRMEALKPYESKEVGPRVFRMATSDLAAGEYFFYLIGSADSVKGIQGKGYDFGVD